MKVFYTPTTEHLQEYIDLPIGSVEFKTFSDGELFVKVNEDVRGKKVWIIAATNPPARNLIQTLLLLNALQRAGATINLLFTYFGYLRQDRPKPGEAASGQYMCELFNAFSLNKIIIIHAHSAKLKTYLNFESVIPYPLFDEHAQAVDAIAAPDKGAWDFTQKIAQQCGKPAVLIEKMRPEKEMVKTIKITGDVDGKSMLIVDDMISTGKTIISAATMLREHGASSISVIATHNLMSQETIEHIDASIIEKVFVTNTIEPWIDSDKIVAVDIGPFIEKVIKNANDALKV